MNRDFKGVWISREIWLDQTLTWMQKLLLVEIDSLDSHDHCFASNAHFAEHLQLSKSRISDLVSSLEKAGYIKCFLEYKGKQVIKRTITITNKVVSIPNTPHRETAKVTIQRLIQILKRDFQRRPLQRSRPTRLRSPRTVHPKSLLITTKVVVGSLAVDR